MQPPQETPEMSETPDKAEAQRLKSLAEAKLRSSSLTSALKYAQKSATIAPDLPGIAEMITTLKILTSDPSDHYNTLLLPPFSAPSTIRKQYKALALALHPDKSSSTAGDGVPAAEDAFKRVADSFRFLSDRFRKQDFDLRLRLALASDATREAGGSTVVDVFSSSCGVCGFVREFDRKYVGFRLVCPGCKNSFLAADAPRSGERQEFEESERVVRTRSGLRSRDSGDDERRRPEVVSSRGPTLVGKEKRRPVVSSGSQSGIKRKDEAVASPVGKRARVGPEKTLAEIQMEIAKAREKTKEKQNGHEKGKGKAKEVGESLNMNGKKGNVKEKSLGDLIIKQEQVGLMAVVDSDFYNFDTDRTEKSFGKGQVWALYDDDDGMPRHYGLIEGVVSSHPFRVKMNWLDIQVQGNEELIHWENSGYHISCGRFKIGKTADITCVNFFSHLVTCERATRDIYRIYPRKGSVWALYREESLGAEKERNYDIVVSLTSYTVMYGLSIAYLEKVKGYRSIFRRKAIGCHAIKWIEKDDFRLFSHEIPAQKLSKTQTLDLPGECWELDPASLPPELLTIGWNKK